VQGAQRALGELGGAAWAAVSGAAGRLGWDAEAARAEWAAGAGRRVRGFRQDVARTLPGRVRELRRFQQTPLGQLATAGGVVWLFLSGHWVTLLKLFFDLLAVGMVVFPVLGFAALRRAAQAQAAAGAGGPGARPPPGGARARGAGSRGAGPGGPGGADPGGAGPGGAGPGSVIDAEWSEVE